MLESWARILVLALIAVGSLGSATVAEATGNPKKVRICHVPPGNPESRQTILVSAQAVPAHLRHGDTIGACSSGCVADPAACDDENLCTDDFCTASGECAHQPVDCNDGNACTRDSCRESGGCINDPSPVNGSTCDDGNACTSGDVCQAAACAGGPLPGCCLGDLDCDDQNLCSVDLCIANTCVNAPKNCSLGEVCGIPDFSDACVVSFCNQSDGACATTPVACDDGNLCTIDFCNSGSGCGSVPTSDGPEEPAELTCGDGLDNDCDGATDSADSDCPPEPVCVPGSEESQACGFCGMQSRVCGADGQWTPWGACGGQGECQPGDIDVTECGPCFDGIRTRTCDATCTWAPAPCVGGTSGGICP